MQRPPRQLEEPLFGRAMILSGLIQGLGILAVVVTIYAVMLTTRIWRERRPHARLCLHGDRQPGIDLRQPLMETTPS